MTRRRARDARRGLCLRRANANFVGGARARGWARPGWGLLSWVAAASHPRLCVCAGPCLSPPSCGHPHCPPEMARLASVFPCRLCGLEARDCTRCVRGCVRRRRLRDPMASIESARALVSLGPSPTDAEKAERSGLSRRALTNGGRVVVLWAGHAPWWGQWEAPAGAPTCVGSSIEQSTAGGTRDGGKTIVPAIASAPDSTLERRETAGRRALDSDKSRRTPQS